MVAKIGLAAVMEMANFNAGMKEFMGGMDSMTGSAEKGASGLSSILGTAGKAVLGFGAAAGAAVVGVGGAALKLAADAAAIPNIAASFESLGGSIEKMREGSLGMVEDVELMKSFNTAASLVSKDFAQQLPDAMGYLSKVSAATGQDMGFMIDSLVKGVGRMSPMILDNLGIQVALSDATARAAEMFGVEEDALTKTQQQAGMMDIVLGKLRDNTATMPDVTESAATQMAAFSATMKNLKAQAGVALIPVLQALLKPLAEIVSKYGPKLTAMLVPMVEKFMPMLSAGLSALGGLAGKAFGGLAESVGKVMPFLEPLWEVLKGLFFGEGVNTDWLAEIFAGLGLPPGLADSISQVFGVIGDVVAQVRPILGEFVTSLGRLAPSLIQIGIAGAGMATSIGSVWQSVFPAMLAIFQTVWTTAQGIIETAIPVILNIIQTMTPVVQQMAAMVSKIVGDLLAFIVPLVQKMVVQIGEWVKLILGWINENLPLIQATITTVLGAIMAVWNFVWPYLQKIVEGVWNALRIVIDTAIHVILGVIKAVMQMITGDWEGAWKTILGIADTIWDGIKDLIGNALDTIAGIIGGKVGEFINLGRDLIEGLMDGIRQKASDMINMVAGYVSDAIQAAKNVLGIRSPSKEFADIGLDMMLGLAEGVDEGQIDVVNKVTGAMRGVIDMVKDLLGVDFSGIDKQSVFSYTAWQRYWHNIKHIGGTIFDLVNGFSDEVKAALGPAAQAAKDTTALFDILTVDFSNVADAKLPTEQEWQWFFARYKHIGGMIYDHMVATSVDLADSIGAAAGVAGDIVKLFDILKISFELPTIGEGFSTGVRGFLDSLSDAVATLVPGLKGIGKDMGDSLDEAVLVSSKLSQLMGVFDAVLAASQALDQIWELGGLSPSLIQTVLNQVEYAAMLLGQPLQMGMEIVPPASTREQQAAGSVTNSVTINLYDVGGGFMGTYSSDIDQAGNIDIHLLEAMQT